MPEIIPTETVILKHECLDPGCQLTVDVKANKNRRLYYFCLCGSHHRYSTEVSKAMIRRFQASDKPAPTPPAPPPAPPQEQEDDGYELFS